MRSYTHSLSFIDIQESIDGSLTTIIMEGWQLDFAEKWVERQSMEMRMCWRLNKTFPLPMYLSFFWYRFSNPVTLMVRTVGFDIWFRWYQLTSRFRLRSSKIGSKYLSRARTSHSFDVIAAVKGTGQAQSRCQVLLLFCHQHHSFHSLLRW